MRLRYGVGVGTAVVGAAGLAVLLVTGGEPLHRVGGGATPLSGTAYPSRTASQSAAASQVGSSSPHSASPATSASGRPLVRGAGPFLAVGSERTNRLLVASVADLQRRLAERRQDFPARVVTPEVGAAKHMLALPGQRLVVTATNQPELVLLTDQLRKVRTLDVRPALGVGTSLVTYGSMSLRGTTLYLAAAWADRVAALAVDTDRWTLIRSRVLPGRFASYPDTCLTDTGTLVVATTTHLSLLRPTDLAVISDVDLPDQPAGGLVCARGQIVVSGYAMPTLYRYTNTGQLIRTTTWGASGGSSVMIADGRHLYVADQDGHRIVRCDLAGTTCQSSARLDGQPVSIVRAGRYVLVALDAVGKTTAVDPVTLAVKGHLPIPGGPRGFAVLT